MEKELKTLKETLTDGFRIDVPEGFRKIIRSQFGGDPGKSFAELIQNYIDSYPSSVPMEERLGEITSGQDWIAMTDYGSGMSLEKIRLLLTLGGSDKDPEQQIGHWGIGFFSMLNPRLATRRVEIVTRCEGEVAGITLELPDAEQLPCLSLRVLGEKIGFSTRVKVIFATETSVARCLAYAKKVLHYYPCKVTINGEPYVNVWQDAASRTRLHTRPAMKGFALPNRIRSSITLLCRYEYVTTMAIHWFPKGGHNLTYDLDDLSVRELPYIPRHDVVVCSNRLHLTISRDGFYLDEAFLNTVEFVREILMEQLVYGLESNRFSPQLILANLYILRRRIKYFLDTGETEGLDLSGRDVYPLLLDAKVFPLADSAELYSLNDILRNLTPGYPLFYSEEKLNTHWLGGAFRHDFIMLPAPPEIFNGAVSFYRKLLGTFFPDLVDLDKIQKDFIRIRELVDRDIVDKSALTPHCEFVGNILLTPSQRNLLEELNEILGTKEVKEVIAANLRVSVGSITTVFFTVDQEGAYISAGLFLDGGIPFSEELMTNFGFKDGVDPGPDILPKDLLLGLRLDHPVINLLMESQDRYKAYYTLTYVAHELALSQKMLVPFSPMFHLVKERLAAEMRMAMMNRILSAG